MGWLKNLLGFGDDPETAKAKKRMAADQADARRRFVFCVLSMSYEVDPGYLPAHSSKAVREWYGIGDRDELISRIRNYAGSIDANNGYDGFLGTFLARGGEGANYLSADESWNMAFEVGRRIQATFGSWREFGLAYLAGHVAYRESQGDSPERLAEMRDNVSQRISRHENTLWAATPFNTPL